MDNINRDVHFMTAPIFNPEDKTGINNKWNYNRAPEGYLFLLSKIEFSSAVSGGTYSGIVSLFDGHEYTHWNLWPGVESREILTRTEFHSYETQHVRGLHEWECKEYTIGIRSTNLGVGFKICAVMWYYLKKASRMELMEYAIKHPKNPHAFKRVLRGPTIEPTEAE